MEVVDSTGRILVYVSGTNCHWYRFMADSGRVIVRSGFLQRVKASYARAGCSLQASVRASVTIEPYDSDNFAVPPSSLDHSDSNESGHCSMQATLAVTDELYDSDDFRDSCLPALEQPQPASPTLPQRAPPTLTSQLAYPYGARSAPSPRQTYPASSAPAPSPPPPPPPPPTFPTLNLGEIKQHYGPTFFTAAYVVSIDIEARPYRIALKDSFGSLEIGVTGRFRDRIQRLPNTFVILGPITNGVPPIIDAATKKFFLPGTLTQYNLAMRPPVSQDFFFWQGE